MPAPLPSNVAPNELVQSAWGNSVVDRFDAIRAGRANGSSGTTTSTTSLLIASLAGADVGPGLALVIGSFHCSLTVITDQFDVTLSATPGVIAMQQLSGAARFPVCVAGVVSIPDGAWTMELRIARTTGTGTAEVFGSSDRSVLSYLIIPNA